MKGENIMTSGQKLNGVEDQTPAHGSLSNLSRLLASENSASDVLALLIELDDTPLRDLLGLPNSRSYTAARELSTGFGRIDLVVFDAEDEHPVAVLEMKGASSLHGDQLDRYVEWVDTLDVRPKLYLCSFDIDEAEASADWGRIRLRDIFASWEASSNAHAAWLSREIVRVLSEWDLEADGVLGQRAGYYVPDIVTKRMAREVSAELSALPGITSAIALRDNGGSPMILAWAAHPRDMDDFSVAVGVDLRSPVRRSGSTVWKLRAMVEVDPVTGVRGRVEARRLAFNLASDLRTSMSGTAVRAELRACGMDKVADSLSSGKRDGFRRDPSGFDFDAWRGKITDGVKYPGGGVFGSDGGLRLSTIHDLDTRMLTRHDIVDAVVAVVGFLRESRNS
ncbi:hypothetical protein [Brevibacterium yomogidense]|uniref:hypothetical protein n=1 Tax=Brevibacterium yomogidense TaxID=946573 RepID=UPI000B35112C|nr:hypothetical protein [Brevibacterium yomogidense]